MQTNDLARLIFEALVQLGRPDDAPAIVERVRRLAYGLPAEDEFSVILNWLGRCRLVHKLDQLQHPLKSRETYRVPDMLAVFECDSSTIPVLIEVKSTVDPIISWRQDYIFGLQTYAKLLNLPLLVAWKWQDFWTLFDITHFKLAVSNYHVKIFQARENNLMSLLAGDYSFKLRPGVGIHLYMKKLDQKGNMKIERAFFTDAAGREHIVAPRLMALFTCIRDDVHIEDDGTHIMQSFIIPTISESQIAHHCLVQLISNFGNRDQPTTWRSYLQGSELPGMSHGLHDAVRELGLAFIELDTPRPAQHPPFLPIRPRAGLER